MIVDDFMTLEQRHGLIKEGVVILRKIVSQDLCRAAIEAVKRKEGGASDAVQALYHNSPLHSLLQDLLGGQVLPVTSAQIAVRMPTPTDQIDIYMGRPTPSPFDWNGHVDGIAIHPGPHENNPDHEAPIMSFSALVGVALSEQIKPDCGNFAVLRGSHLTNAAFFAHQASKGGPLGPGGPDWPLEPWHRQPGSNASRGQWPDVRPRMIPPPTRSMGDSPRYVGESDNGSWWPSATQQLMSKGDAVIAHYLTCHGESRHVGKKPRNMVFFRIKHHLHTEYRPRDHKTAEMRYMTEVLSDPWLEWSELEVDKNFRSSLGKQTQSEDS